MSGVSVTSKGQVTIPKHIRDELGIAPGAKVEFELAGSAARMRLVGRPARSRIEDGPAILNYSGPRIPVGDLNGLAAAKRSQNVRAVDTNILARYYLQDDAAQANRARGLLEDGDLFVPKTVLLELEWVLRGVAGQPRAKVLACLEHLVALPGITVEDSLQVNTALAAAESGLDFADALHHAASADREGMLTFDDRAFARRAARLRLTPTVIAPGRR